MFNRWSIGTKISAGFALGLTVFAAIGIVSYRSTNQLISTAREEAQTQQVLSKLEAFLSLMKDAETGQRGYLITGEERYLEPYNHAVQLMDQHINELRSMTEGDSTQRLRLENLEKLKTERVEVLQTVVVPFRK